MREDDTILLRRFADTGAEGAFAELVARNINAVYSAALRRVGGDRHLAEDVVQQVFIRLAAHAESLVRHPMLTAWLYAATRNAAANVVRTEVRRRAREQEACAMDEITGSRGREPDWTDVAPHLDEVIDALSDKDRSAVLLRFFEQLTFAEMAHVLHASEDAVRMRVDRALDKMRVALGRRGIASTNAALGGVLAQNVVLAAPGALANATARNALAALPAAPAASALAAGTFTVTAAVLAVLFAASGLYLHRQRVEAEAQLADAQRQMLSRQPALAEPGAPPLVAAGGNAEIHREQPPVSRPVGERADDAVAGRFVVEREVREGGRRALISTAYTPFYRMLGLTEQQVRRFEDIRLQGSVPSLWMYSLDHEQAAAITPVDTSAPPGTVETELRALLGPDGYARYQHYSRTIPGRELAARLASAVYQSDPLSAVQAEQFANIAADSVTATATSALAELDWDLLVQRASAVLSPKQLDALARVVRQKDALSRALAEQNASVSQTRSEP